MRTLLLAFAFVFAGLFATSFRVIPGSKHFTIHKLAPGVWAAINNDNYGHAICNAGIIDLGDKTLIFDPFMNIDAAQDLKLIARKLTRRDAGIVVNSHYHNDHVRGNQVFLPATIISTEWTKHQMAVSEPQELAWELANATKLLADNKEKFARAHGREKGELAVWIGYYEGMVVNDPYVRTTLPDLTFNDSLWIQGSERSVKLVEIKGGHTSSDLVLELPSEGIIFMGDLLFEGRHPYLPDGRWDSWVDHLLDFYYDEDYSKFVPGHGDICGKEQLKILVNYINNLHDLVQAQVNRGVSDSIIRQLPIPTAYLSWKFRQFYPSNLAYMSKELRTGTKAAGVHQ
jgi:cyclase